MLCHNYGSIFIFPFPAYRMNFMKAHASGKLGLCFEIQIVACVLYFPLFLLCQWESGGYFSFYVYLKSETNIQRSICPTDQKERFQMTFRLQISFSVRKGYLVLKLRNVDCRWVRNVCATLQYRPLFPVVNCFTHL